MGGIMEYIKENKIENKRRTSDGRFLISKISAVAKNKNSFD